MWPKLPVLLEDFSHFACIKHLTLLELDMNVLSTEMPLAINHYFPKVKRLLLSSQIAITFFRGIKRQSKHKLILFKLSTVSSIYVTLMEVNVATRAENRKEILDFLKSTHKSSKNKWQTNHWDLN